MVSEKKKKQISSVISSAIAMIVLSLVIGGVTMLPIILAFVFVMICIVARKDDGESSSSKSSYPSGYLPEPTFGQSSQYQPQGSSTNTTAGRKCIYCGATLPAGSDFCPQCGGKN
ncbi:MAG: hypothetical protein GF364_08405 [Candidatus Lokiarchaeota archaeon]|nr:hypothetical protein [Candidatus Lokiarchaeota archaeon]